MNRKTDNLLSPAAAAKRAGCGRTSVVRALESKALAGNRDNLNHWRIAPEDLDKWAEPRRDTFQQSRVTDAPVSTTAVDDNFRAVKDLAVAEARVAELLKIIDRSDADRDRTEKRHQAELIRMQDVIRDITRPKPSLLDRISAAFSK
jgi:hypothetical protein